MRTRARASPRHPAPATGASSEEEEAGAGSDYGSDYRGDYGGDYGAGSDHSGETEIDAGAPPQPTEKQRAHAAAKLEACRKAVAEASLTLDSRWECYAVRSGLGAKRQRVQYCYRSPFKGAPRVTVPGGNSKVSCQQLQTVAQVIAHLKYIEEHGPPPGNGEEEQRAHAAAKLEAFRKAVAKAGLTLDSRWECYAVRSGLGAKRQRVQYFFRSPFKGAPMVTVPGRSSKVSCQQLETVEQVIAHLKYIEERVRGLGTPPELGLDLRPAKRPRNRHRDPWDDDETDDEAMLDVNGDELRGDLREAELKIDGLATKSAQQERLIAHLERFNALVLEENEELRRLLANGAVEA